MKFVFVAIILVWAFMGFLGVVLNSLDIKMPNIPMISFIIFVPFIPFVAKICGLL